MSKLSAAHMRQIIDSLATIESFIRAMRAETRIPSADEVYGAAGALDRMRDLILKAAVSEVEVEAPSRKRDRTAPQTDSVSPPAVPVETQATGADASPPVADLPLNIRPSVPEWRTADPVPAATAAPMPEAAEIMTPLTSGVVAPDEPPEWLDEAREPQDEKAMMEQLADGMIDAIHSLTTFEICGIWEAIPEVRAKLLDLASNDLDRHTQVMAALRSRQLLLKVKACTTKAEALETNKDAGLIRMGQWLMQNATQVYAKTVADMKAHVQGLPA